MLAFLLRRLGQSALVVLVMASLVFVGVYALGNPIDILISPEADQLEREQAIARLGLDKPFWMQFWLFLAHALSGDLGKSFVHGIPAGLLAGLKPDSLPGRLIMTGSIFGFSLPNFFFHATTTYAILRHVGVEVGKMDFMGGPPR